MNTKKLTYTALFVTLGIIIPQIFHWAGGSLLASILLPMHIPALLGGLLLGPLAGMSIGMLSVLVGSVLGMPQMPIAVFMFFELATYGLLAGYLGKYKKINVYISLVVSMLAGRLVSMSLILFAMHVLQITLPAIFGKLAMFSAGIPGMILQIALIPPLVILLKRQAFMDE